jgi:hypothetical protein
MGYCEIIPIKGGIPQNGIEFRNPWRGVPIIWNALFDKYLKNPEVPYDSWLLNHSKGKGKLLWNLAKRADLPMFERAVHAFTFDRAYARREHFKRLSDDLRAFDVEYPVEYPSHLSAWTDVIQSLDADAVGLYGTSVSSNPWWEYDEEKDEMIPYRIEDGFEIYDWLK